MINRTLNYLLVVTGLMVTTFSNAQTQKTMEKQEMMQDQKNVLKVIKQMTNAFHHKDIDGIMATYELNPLVVFEPEKTVSDRANLIKMFQEAFIINPKFTYSGHEVFINGDIATHFAPWVMTGKAPDGTKITQNGLSVAVLRKQHNGEWLIIFDNPHGSFLMKNE